MTSGFLTLINRSEKSGNEYILSRTSVDKHDRYGMYSVYLFDLCDGALNFQGEFSMNIYTTLDFHAIDYRCREREK